MAKPLDGVYTPDKRTLVKVKHERTAECAVAGFRVHKDGEGVGSLLLGLYDESGRLHHVGVCASFNAKFRRELIDDLGPLTEPTRSATIRGASGRRHRHSPINGCRADSRVGT